MTREGRNRNRTPRTGTPTGARTGTPGGVEERVWRHWKSLKGYYEFKAARVEDGLTPGGLVFGHVVPTTPNHVWLLLARTHRLRVREVKDIINARRGRTGPGSHLGGPAAEASVDVD